MAVEDLTSPNKRLAGTDTTAEEGHGAKIGRINDCGGSGNYRP